MTFLSSVLKNSFICYMALLQCSVLLFPSEGTNTVVKSRNFEIEFSPNFQSSCNLLPSKSNYSLLNNQSLPIASFSNNSYYSGSGSDLLGLGITARYKALKYFKIGIGLEYFLLSQINIYSDDIISTLNGGNLNIFPSVTALLPFGLLSIYVQLEPLFGFQYFWIRTGQGSVSVFSDIVYLTRASVGFDFQIDSRRLIGLRLDYSTPNVSFRPTISVLY